MPFLVSIFLGFTPMLLFALILFWVDRYEQEPILLIGAVFTWGAIVAAGGAFIINTFLGLGIFIFTNSEVATNLATGSLIAPLIEEILKGGAVLLVFLIFRREFDSILDGIIYAGVAALGFAATENTFYIYSYGYQESGWSGIFSLAFVRIILVGWQHPFYTSFIGIGLALNRISRSRFLKFAGPFIGFCLAVFTHSIHNSLAAVLTGTSGLVLGTLIDWSGWFIMLLFMLYMVSNEQRNLKNYLLDEVQKGTITLSQYKSTISFWRPLSIKISAFFKGKFKITKHFYQLCGELAHKKHQYHKLGDEEGNLEIIQNLQSELSRLSVVI